MSVARPIRREEEHCGFGCFRPAWLHKFVDIRIFVTLMCIVIGVQGTYLGYMVGVLTSIERRFEITSSKIGTLLAVYDIGHTSTVLLVGYFGAHRHKPRWTAIGVVLSGIAMFGLALPNFLFGATSFSEHFISRKMEYINRTTCDTGRPVGNGLSLADHCEEKTNTEAYGIMVVSQLLAGVAAAPFNTLAYIYIDDNVSNRESPFYLGLLTSMYAFGPAVGFGLSAICTFVYADLTTPLDIDRTNPNWIGAWWLGFIVCGVLYLLSCLPLFMFPIRIPDKERLAHKLHPQEFPEHQGLYETPQFEPQKKKIKKKSDVSCGIRTLAAVKEFGKEVWQLLVNPVYSSMLVGWIFGAYLVGGYGTYLPKFFETQYAQTSTFADIYAGIIAIGSVAVSTAVGGYILTRFDVRPHTATLYLIITWSAIVLTYIIGMFLGCPESRLAGEESSDQSWNFTLDCNKGCHCDVYSPYNPVCADGVTYFSPCHAGCKYDYKTNDWRDCACSNTTRVTIGQCTIPCNNMPYYIAVMFVGFFAGNLFFMVTMMVILRCVKDELKSLGLSFASAITNIFGFIPSPIIFGAVIDTACSSWHKICPDSGNCLVYDNKAFRYQFHAGNAAFQLVAILAVSFTYWKSRSFKFPEENEEEEWEAEESGEPLELMELRS